MYRILAYCLVICSVFLSGCRKEQEGINWNVSLGDDDKDPYGSYLAYKSMKHFFPGAKVEALSSGFRYDNIDSKMLYDKGTSLLVLTGLSFNISDDEFNTLLRFVRAGNEVVIFSATIDNKLEEHLDCYKPYFSMDGGSEETPLSIYNTGRDNVESICLATDTTKKYGYVGRSIQGFFQIDSSENKSTEEVTPPSNETIEQPDGEKITIHTEDGDTIMYETTTETEPTSETAEYEIEEDTYDDSYSGIEGPEILGTVKGQPQIVRYRIGSGHITMHAAPLVTSNYFLLQEKNIDYLQGVWNTLPEEISHVYWNSFYRHHAEHSDWGILWRHPATRWAISLAFISLLLYVLLEIKRRQNAMAIMKPLENTSVTFVETVGRLYYNKGNHGNLAEKMVQHFLEWVRNYYYLNTNHMDDDFVKSLTLKSGLPIEVVRNMVEMIDEVRTGRYVIDEPYLYHLNNTIQRFYKNKNS